MSPRAGQLRADLPGGPVLLRWTEWGPPEGAPVLCVHGLTRNGRDFDALAMELARRGRRVLCPDMPGRGHSSWLADGALYAVPSYLAVLAPLLEALGEHDWVGTSMGGLIGMGLCATPGARMRRLVLNDIGPFVPVAALERIRDYLSVPQRFASLDALEAYLRRVHAPFGPLSDAEWRHLAVHSARATAAGELALHYDPAIVQPMLAPLADLDLWALWPAVTQRPVLVLRGESSDLLLPETAARMAESPAVRLATIPGCGHAPALMEPAQIALVADFLS
ncbi:MAG: alpha/beta hydrolase [Roseococcus sp.]|nr:alpha/beta hydrolase [Roseococcus sp.]